MVDLQNEVIAEANEYYSHLTAKGIEGDALIEALKEEAAQARQWGREDLAEAIDIILQDSDDGTLTRRMVTSRGDVVDTELTDEEAIEVLRTMKWSEFATSMVVQYDKPRKGKKTAQQRLSDRQWPWAHKLANEQLAREAKKAVEATKPKPTFKAIPALFDKALASGHKTPRITLDMDEGRIRLSVAGPNSRTPGVIHVTDGGPFGDNIYFGRIERDGTLKGRQTPEWVMDTLRQLDGETLEFVVKYGQKTGNCCFCNSELVTTESVTAGYGPICADRYGLPWG